MSNPHLSFLRTDPQQLLSLAGRVADKLKRPPTLDREDVVQDACVALLEIATAAPLDWVPPTKYPLGLWLTLQARQKLGAKAAYYREFQWANRRLLSAGHGEDEAHHRNNGGALGIDHDGEAVIPEANYHDTDAALRELLDLVPATLRPIALRLLHGETQAAVVASLTTKALPVRRARAALEKAANKLGVLDFWRPKKRAAA